MLRAQVVGTGCTCEKTGQPFGHCTALCRRTAGRIVWRPVVNGQFVFPGYGDTPSPVGWEDVVDAELEELARAIRGNQWVDLITIDSPLLTNATVGCLVAAMADCRVDSVWINSPLMSDHWMNEFAAACMHRLVRPVQANSPKVTCLELRDMIVDSDIFALVAAALIGNTHLHRLDINSTNAINDLFQHDSPDIRGAAIREHLVPALARSNVCVLEAWYALEGGLSENERDVALSIQATMAPRYLRWLAGGNTLPYDRDLLWSTSKDVDTDRELLVGNVWPAKFGDPEARDLGLALKTSSTSSVHTLDFSMWPDCFNEYESSMTACGWRALSQGIKCGHCGVVGWTEPTYDCLHRWNDGDYDCRQDQDGRWASCRKLMFDACRCNALRLLSANDCCLTTFVWRVSAEDANGCAALADAVQGNTYLSELHFTEDKHEDDLGSNTAAPRRLNVVEMNAICRAISGSLLEVVSMAGAPGGSGPNPDGFALCADDELVAQCNRLCARNKSCRGSVQRNRPYQRLLLAAIFHGLPTAHFLLSVDIVELIAEHLRTVTLYRRPSRRVAVAVGASHSSPGSNIGMYRTCPFSHAHYTVLPSHQEEFAWHANADLGDSGADISDPIDQEVGKMSKRQKHENFAK